MVLETLDRPDTDTDSRLIALIQHGLPLVSEPYAVLAEQLGISTEAVLQRLEALLQQGIIKRFGLVVRHHELGFIANAMVVWDVPDADIDALGQQLGQYPCVTLCYQRPRRLPHWRYNLFCMIHGKSRDSVLSRIQTLIDERHLAHLPHQVLFSQRRFKQCGAKYR